MNKNNNENGMMKNKTITLENVICVLHSDDLLPNLHSLVLLLGIFRRALRSSATSGHPCAFYFPRGALPLFLKIFY
jgi:hypothetical protein